MTKQEAIEILEHLVKKADCFNCQYRLHCVDETKGYCVQALQLIRKELKQ